MPRAVRVVAIYMISDATGRRALRRRGLPSTGRGRRLTAVRSLLDGTNVNRDSGVVAYASGVAFTAGADVGLQVVSSGWTPTTANITLWMTVRFEPFLNWPVAALGLRLRCMKAATFTGSMTSLK